jgi:threonylcarbamoyladenosine tRNA methylthiotransferase MtaB
MDHLARRALADGHQIVASPAAADLVVVNSCTVTHAAARSSRKAARRAGRRGAGARTVLTGCHVDGSPDEAARLAGVDLVVPNRRKDELLDLVYQRFPQWRPETAATTALPYALLELGATRALLKIEDGCNMRCAFCVIPLTRGRQRSRRADAIVEDAARMVGGGYREVVLTGVQISAYRDRGLRLSGLVGRLIEATAEARFRLTSIAPWDFDPALIDLAASGRVCRHFHLSLQSGCDRTLRRMRRPYDRRAFTALVESIRARLPGVAITTDVIVGFPGESEGDFATGLEFVAAMAFARVHAFPYSRLHHRVAPAELRRRMERLGEVARRSERVFRSEQLGHTLQVLWERPRNGTWQGTSDNYVRVASDESRALHHRLTPTLIEDVRGDFVVGRPLLAA